MNAQNEAQREADEIIRNATKDLRARAISLFDWWHITRLALLDGYLSELCESVK